MADLTTKNFIRYFEDKLRRIDYHKGGTVGKEPQFPMMVVYLGENAANAHEMLSGQLKLIWPQYHQELCFIGVRKAKDSTEFFEPEKDGRGTVYKTIDEKKIGEKVSSLFGLMAHFQDRSKLLVYYVLDTTPCENAEDFAEWFGVIDSVKKTLRAEQMDMLMLLLNEDFSHEAAAKQIRNKICEIVNGDGSISASVFLLSNCRSDNAILENWDMCYRIMADMIALSNNNDTRIMLSMYERGMKTVSYAREEKPSAAIGQIIVHYLIDELDKHRDNPVKLKLLKESPPHLRSAESDASLPRKLGITKEGTVSILDGYAEQTLFPYLPGAGDLELFPRPDEEERGKLAELSFHEFDRLTMGAWGSFLHMLTKQTEEKGESSSLRGRWCEEYGALLFENFSAEELVYLKNHINELRGFFQSPQKPSGDLNVLSTALAQLKYILSSNEELIKVFLDTVLKQGETASEFIRSWNKLRQSYRNMFSIKDENITAFYGKKIRDYLDHNGNDKIEAFKKLHKEEDLESFLKHMIDEVINSDRIYYAPFEEELELRLREEAVSNDAKAYIRKKLAGDEVYTYFRANFSLGEPLLTAMLLKSKTPLHVNLMNNLDPTIYYYDTGYSNAAEALVIYSVTAENLVNG